MDENKRQGSSMANVETQVIPAVIRFLTRAIIGAIIGIAVVVLFVGIDYVGQTDRRFYFIDHGDAIVAVLTIGVLIGTLIGLGWALNSMRRNKNGEGAV
jgi:hypothetical protein